MPRWALRVQDAPHAGRVSTGIRSRAPSWWGPATAADMSTGPFGATTEGLGHPPTALLPITGWGETQELSTGPKPLETCHVSAARHKLAASQHVGGWRFCLPADITPSLRTVRGRNKQL